MKLARVTFLAVAAVFAFIACAALSFFDLPSNRNPL